MRLALRRDARRGAAAAVVIDRDARLPGRGAYLCAEAPGTPVRACLELALRRGAIARTLRCAPKIDCSNLLESVGR